MKFLAEEFVDQQIVDRLRHDGHTVLYVAEMEPGISDQVDAKGLLPSSPFRRSQVADHITLLLRTGFKYDGIVPDPDNVS